MARAAFAMALILALACASPAALSKPQKDPAEPPPDTKPAAAAPAAGATPEPAAAPSQVTRKCSLASGKVRVLTSKQKKCRQASSCACADPCPPCP